jgi:hypothetical protein
VSKSSFQVGRKDKGQFKVFILTELFHLYRIAVLAGTLGIDKVDIKPVLILSLANFTNIDCRHFYEGFCFT